MQRHLILASGSPRRSHLLETAGFTFTVDPPDVAEIPQRGEAPQAMVRRLAVEKAKEVAARHETGSCILACDTTVVLDGEILGKPMDADDAIRTLLRIGGRSHTVFSGYAILAPPRPAVVGLVRSDVIMTPIDPEAAAEYVATGEPLDKAGSYAIQGIGRKFIDHYEGSFSNIMGLPMEIVAPELAAVGVVPDIAAV